MTAQQQMVILLQVRLFHLEYSIEVDFDVLLKDNVDAKKQYRINVDPGCQPNPSGESTSSNALHDTFHINLHTIKKL